MSYVTYVQSPLDVQRNNIYRKRVNINWQTTSGNTANSLLEGTNPQFDGTGQGGLAYRLKAGSPAINTGVIIPGITDGIVGAPDMGAYEFGGTAWVPGYVPVAQTTPSNSLPVGSITAPANNASFPQGSPINITASASDANGSVTRVEFFDGTTKLGEDASSPYSFALNNATVGTHTLTVRVTDNENAVTTSTAVTITVTGNTFPTVAITAPANNAQVTAGAPISITATAADTNGSVNKVEFFDGTTKLGEDLTSPYSFAWNNAAAGTHALTARATDNQNNVTTSAAVNITLVSPSTAPTVSITGPATNTQFADGTPVTITATAADANGSISKVEFFDGTTKLGEDITNTYSFTWNNIPAGTHIITVKATDNQNNATTSSSITIVVGNANIAPLVSIAAPLENSEFSTGSSISITASASDSDGSVTKVEFFDGTTKLGEDLTAPYTFIWNNVPEGSYSLNAVATDNENGVGTSESITITVLNAIAAGGVEDLYSGIPRFFSPNGDGTGDYWEWTQPELFANSLLTIFNRSGQKIFEALSYNNTWDGKQDGQPLQPGDYYYVIKMPDLTELRGSVRILR